MKLYDLNDIDNQNNLKFLLAVSDKTLFDWVNKIDYTDVEYGIDLLESFKNLIQHKIRLLEVEKRIKINDQKDFYPDANQLIKDINKGIDQ